MTHGWGRAARGAARGVVPAFAMLLVASTTLGGVATAQAQTTSPERAMRGAWAADRAADSLVDRALVRRGMQLADSTLLGYQADAHGFLAFLGQLGEGTIIPPRVIQSEELALRIAWWQPGNSAQRLVGRRDTTLLPADVAYYRDRYGVVLDNLPDRIRLGDGQDVRDVPHPLAPNAHIIYEYQRATPLVIRIPGREITVDEVRFRPRNAALPAAIGSVFLDRETGAVVRLSMMFTRSAIIDKRIETLFVTLENGLVNERYWLPRRQEVEVSRGSTWFDIPARGIVRGRWEVSNYTVNEAIAPAVKLQPRWSSAPRDSLRAHPFEGRVIDVLPPEIRIASSEEVARARAQVEAAVRASMLTRPARAAVTGRGVSEFARFSRAEGIALGAGATHTTSGGWTVMARGRYGIADGEVKGRLSVGRVPAFGRAPLVQPFVERDYRDLAPPERAGVTNSLAAALFGSDYTTQVDTRAAGVELRRRASDPFMLRVAYETDRATRVNADALTGDLRATLPAWPLRGARAELRGAGGWIAQSNALPRVLDLVPGLGVFTSFNGRWASAVAAGAYTGADAIGTRVRPLAVRINGSVSMERPLPGDRTLALTANVALSGGRDLPPQWLTFAGGTWSAPGYAFHAFRPRAVASQRIELRQPVPAPVIPLGKYGKAPGHVTLAPFVQATAVSSGIAAIPTPVSGVYPSAGVAALFFFDLVRVEVARGLRNEAGARWRLGFDIDRSFWGIL